MKDKELGSIEAELMKLQASFVEEQVPQDSGGVEQIVFRRSAWKIVMLIIGVAIMVNMLAANFNR